MMQKKNQIINKAITQDLQTLNKNKTHENKNVDLFSNSYFIAYVRLHLLSRQQRLVSVQE